MKERRLPWALTHPFQAYLTSLRQLFSSLDPNLLPDDVTYTEFSRMSLQEAYSALHPETSEGDSITLDS